MSLTWEEFWDFLEVDCCSMDFEDKVSQTFSFKSHMVEALHLKRNSHEIPFIFVFFGLFWLFSVVRAELPGSRRCLSKHTLEVKVV